MAVDDVIADIDSIEAPASVDFQPASGVEIVITGWCNSGTAGNIGYTDGSLLAAITAGQVTRAGHQEMKAGINNTVYLNRAPNTGTVILGYSGIQVK